MANHRNQIRRLVVVGAVAAAAAAAPVLISAFAAPNGGSTVQAGECLAWFGNKDDGICLGYSNGQPIYAGTPDFGIYGPNAGSGPGGGIGITTGPLLPGTTVGGNFSPGG